MVVRLFVAEDLSFSFVGSGGFVGWFFRLLNRDWGGGGHDFR